MINIVSADAGHTPFEIVQANEFDPVPNPVIPELPEEGLAITPVPETRVHIPVPTPGIFPERVADVPQIV
jgi:hypothetical protein